MKGKFIITKDFESAAILEKVGLIKLSADNNHWVFLNDGKVMFENLSDVTYTDKLFI